MISASEAKRQSILNSTAKKYIERLEGAIKKASKNGDCSATISIDIVESDSTFDKPYVKLRNAIVEELVNLGYTVDFEYAKPIPLGCRSDQWNFSNGHIRVEW